MALLNFPLFPEAASTMAPKVDQLYFFLVSVSAVMTALIFLVILAFAIKFRRRSETERPRTMRSPMSLEIVWSVIPLGIVMIMFTWGARLYFLNAQVPKNAMQIYVVGKQWMWKVQHPEGPREINELHVPVNRPVQLIISSQDVIHSFYMPAFRIKRDAVPGTYTTAWFEATKPGEYHLFCAEYCGTDHSRMRGRVVVMEDAEYQQWLSGGGAESMSSAGQQLFQRLGCENCHKQDGSGRCPPLRGVFGRGVGLVGGRSVIADEAYLRESILDPGAKIVAGYPNIMPTFRGLVNEDGLMQLIAYLKSLGGPEAGAPPGQQAQQSGQPSPTPANPRTPQAAQAGETGPTQTGEQPR
ncbi:MAG TPA: cytochrome c oxidase subunit II [Bryobacteraceae bacterium]|nr:cytochrome c oxidase subunit II [Bryobacteraceae bacterium]